MTNTQIEAMKRAKSKEDFARVILDALIDSISWYDRPDYLETERDEILREVWTVFGDN